MSGKPKENGRAVAAEKALASLLKNLPEGKIAVSAKFAQEVGKIAAEQASSQSNAHEKNR